MTTAESSNSTRVSAPVPELRPALSLVASDAPDDALSVDELGSRIVGLAGRLAAATCRWLLLVAAFDAREGGTRFGLPSTARWLSHTCGLSRRTAVEHVRVARALAAHPQLAAAMSAGRLSYSHVRAITRVAAPGEDTLVRDLVMVAENGTVGQLESMVRGLRTIEHNEAEPSGDAGEYLSHRWGSDSRWQLNARLDPEHGAVVRSAIETIARAEGLTQAQALVRMAEIALAAVNDGADPPRALRGEERAAIVVHLDAAALPEEGDEARSAERARPAGRVEHGPGLPDRVVKRLLCSGRIRSAVHDAEGNVRDLGRSHRVVSERQFRALLLREGGCAHPGCGSTHGLEAHHVWHWIHGGRTDLTNLVLLCQAHHHAHHDGAFGIVPLGGGRFRFSRSDGCVLTDHIEPAALIDTDQPLEDEHTDVTDDAATTRWDGSRLDHHYAVAGLAQARSHERACTISHAG